MTETQNSLPIQLQERLATELRSKGLRLTPQREKILDVFYRLPEGDHLSAEDLHNKLKQESTDISLATTYRTLKLLVSVGVLRELAFAEDHKHYELARNPDEPHHHIICMGCGLTQEFDSAEVVNLAHQIADERSIKLVDVQFKLYVLCDACSHDDEH